jgi:hypothetical protein
LGGVSYILRGRFSLRCPALWKSSLSGPASPSKLQLFAGQINGFVWRRMWSSVTIYTAKRTLGSAGCSPGAKATSATDAMM